MLQTTREAFVNLDVELTGKPLRQCQQNACQQLARQDVFELMSNLYYLSDGGYSRLRIADDFTAHLAQGARAEIEFNWLYADREIKALNEALAIEGRIAESPTICIVEGCTFYANDILAQAWLENQCQDKTCEQSRLEAAILSLRGAESDHQYYARVVAIGKEELTSAERPERGEAMDYEAEDKAIHRKIMTEALQRVGATITRNDVTGYLNVGCNDRDELEFALQGAEIMRREAETDFARRNYYNIECALANKLRTTTKKGKCQNCKGRGSIRFGRGITRTTEGCPDCGGTGQTLKIL